MWMQYALCGSVQQQQQRFILTLATSVIVVSHILLSCFMCHDRGNDEIMLLLFYVLCVRVCSVWPVFEFILCSFFLCFVVQRFYCCRLASQFQIESTYRENVRRIKCPVHWHRIVGRCFVVVVVVQVHDTTPVPFIVKLRIFMSLMHKFHSHKEMTAAVFNVHNMHRMQVS